MKKILVGLVFGFISTVFAESTIKIGSTFDYPPVTYMESGNYLGNDIGVITKFAQEKNLKIIFVPTTWQTLNQDLQAHKFDIAVGGISENKARAKLFLFSKPVGKTQKAPLIRCNDIAKYGAIESFNNCVRSLLILIIELIYPKQIYIH